MILLTINYKQLKTNKPMGILTYSSAEEGTQDVIITEDTKAVEETPATPVVDVERTETEE